MRVEPIQPIQKAKQQLHYNRNNDFQKILNKRPEIDNDQVYDTITNDIIEDVDHMSTETVRNLLRED